MVPAIKIVM